MRTLLGVLAGMTLTLGVGCGSAPEANAPAAGVAVEDGGPATKPADCQDGKPGCCPDGQAGACADKAAPTDSSAPPGGN